MEAAAHHNAAVRLQGQGGHAQRPPFQRIFESRQRAAGRQVERGIEFTGRAGAGHDAQIGFIAEHAAFGIGNQDPVRAIVRRVIREEQKEEAG